MSVQRLLQVSFRVPGERFALRALVLLHRNIRARNIRASIYDSVTQASEVCE